MNSTTKKQSPKDTIMGIVGLIIIIFVVKSCFFSHNDTATDTAVKIDSATARKQLIEKSFSAWDGAHIKLKEYVKSQMNDENSFEHISTNYWDRDSFIMVKMQYSGKNAFNATVKETIMAKCALDGSIIKILN